MLAGVPLQKRFTGVFPLKESVLQKNREQSGFEFSELVVGSGEQVKSRRQNVSN